MSEIESRILKSTQDAVLINANTMISKQTKSICEKIQEN